jgi:hypothetical protein
MELMFKLNRTAVSLATAGLLVGGLAACSSSSSGSDAGSTASATPAPAATLTNLSGVDTQVTLDSGFLAALKTLGLTPGVTGSATLTDGALHFPISGGKVTYWDPTTGYRPYVQGEIDHQGSGITLTAGKTVVGLSNFKIDPGISHLTGTVTVNGKVAGTDVFIFNLDGSTLQPLTKDSSGDAILQGTKVLVSSDAAALLDKTFGTTAVTNTLLVGVAKITAK